MAKRITYPGLVEIEVKVKGGFPASYHFSMCGADPSVGIMSPYIDDELITTRNGQKAPWLNLSEKDLEACREAAYKYIDNLKDDHDPY